jgi:hypothetical protein
MLVMSHVIQAIVKQMSHVLIQGIIDLPAVFAGQDQAQVVRFHLFNRILLLCSPVKPLCGKM